MSKFEYLEVERRRSELGFDLYYRDGVQFVYLNKLGNEGWELISDNGNTLVFKRFVSDEELKRRAKREAELKTAEETKSKNKVKQTPTTSQQTASTTAKKTPFLNDKQPQNVKVERAYNSENAKAKLSEEFVWEDRSQGRVLLEVKDKSATAVKVPDGITIIANRAFADMTTMTSLILPSSLKDIKSEAFINCTALKEVAIPPSVLEVGNKAFFNCQNLSKVYFRGDLKKISAEAFANCAIQTVILPGQVEIVGMGAFSGNPMKSARVPTQTQIKLNAFPDGCRVMKG